MNPLLSTRLFLFIGAIALSGIMQLNAADEGSRIDMSVSPIRDEFIVQPTMPTTRTIQYSNNSDVPYNIYITIEDCVPSGNYGTPICKSASGSIEESIYSSQWITVSESSFTVPPQSTKTITYTVNAPANAAPGGHYGAIFFNNPDTPIIGSNTVGMIRRIGMLYMLQISGNIVVDPSIGDILVDGPGGSGGGGDTSGGILSYLSMNGASKIYDTVKKNWNNIPMWQEIVKEVNPLWDKPMLENQDFNLTIKVPVKNDGNIHIRPTGKIYIFDEDNQQLEKIGKESIVDENGVYAGEIIVDYLPINDERGNVLPNTERTYEVNWSGFGYEERDPQTGKYVIKFESLSSYYSRIASEGSQFIYPWERLSIRNAQRTLGSKMEFSYTDVTTGKVVTQTTEIPLSIEYRYIAKTLNYGIVSILFFILLISWIMIRARDKRIEYLEEETLELEDEISVLERAKKAHITKETTTNKKKLPTKKETINKSTRGDTAKEAPTKKVTTKKTSTTGSSVTKK